MIKKLKRRFLFILMIVVTLILTVTFSVLIISSSTGMKTESFANLNKDYSRLTETMEIDYDNTFSDYHRIDRIKPFGDRSPFFTFYVQINEDGSINKVFDYQWEISEDTVNKIVSNALEQGNTTGTIRDYGLRYKFYSKGEIIGFIDNSYEMDFIKNQILNYSLILAGCIAIFFIINIFLARVASRPIEKAWKKQRLFVADASHELKTPITILLANTSMLLDERNKNSKDSHRWIQNINIEAKHMEKLVEDFLFLAKADSVKDDYDMIYFDLSDTVMQNTLTFEALMFESNHELITEIQDDIKIKGNQNQIKQLINILIDNAMKYSYPDTKISLRLFKESNKAILSVHNFSAPISESDLPYIFDRFYKVDKSRNRNSNSYGLGLAIAHEIVSLHNGKIYVISDEKSGTIFTVYLQV